MWFIGCLVIDLFLIRDVWNGIFVRILSIKWVVVFEFFIFKIEVGLFNFLIFLFFILIYLFFFLIDMFIFLKYEIVFK